ncbi:GRIP domain-containing protein [Pycnococcus provasolii]
MSSSSSSKPGPFANKTREELETLLTGTVKKLKATDAKLKDLQKNHDETIKQQAASTSGDDSGENEKRIAQLEQERDDARKESAERTAERDGATAEAEGLRKQIVDLEARSASAEIAGGEEVRTLQERLKQAEMAALEVPKLQSALSAAKEEAEALRMAKNDAMTQLAQAESSREGDVNAQVEKAREEAKDMKRKLDETTKKFAKVAEKKQAEFKSELEKSKKELENTAAKLSAKESELSAAETRVASLETQLGEASTVARRAQTASDQAEARASSAAEELAQLKLKSAAQSRDDDDRLDEMYQEMDALRADAEKLERQLNESRRLYSEKEQEALEANAQLEEAKEVLARGDAASREEVEKLKESVKVATARLEEEMASQMARLKEARDEAAAATSRADKLEATAGGDKARLQALLDSKTADLTRWTKEMESERERVKHALGEAKKKLAKAEKAKQAAEAKVSEMRQQVEESKASGVAASETILLELRESKAEIERLSEEASHYRARAVKTLKSKDDEIAQLKDEAHITGLHERLQSLEDVNERVTSELSAARDEAEKLRDELAKLGQEAASRMREVKEGYQKRLAELEGKLVRMREETMENASSTLSASKAQQPASTDEALALELSELRRAAAAAAKGRDGAASDLRRREAAHAAERKEFESFRTMASAMLEEKDEEIRKLLDELADERSALRRRENQPAAAAATASNALPRPSTSASPRHENGHGNGFDDKGDEEAKSSPSTKWRDGDDILSGLGVGTAGGGDPGTYEDLVMETGRGSTGGYDDYDASLPGFDASLPGFGQGFLGGRGGSNLVQLAQLQAMRDEEMMSQMRQITELSAEVSRLTETNTALSREMRRARDDVEEEERLKKRAEVAESATNVTYLKNVVLKLLETGEGDALLPILSRLLQFSPDEAQRAHKAMADAAAPPLPAAAAAVDAMGSAVSMLSSYLNTTTTTTSAATGSGAASASTTTTTPRS